MASGGRKSSSAHAEEISKTRVRISAGHPKYPPLIKSDELRAALKQLGCEPLHIEDRGSFFLVTIGEEAVARFVGQSVAVRNHKSTIDPYTLRNESDRRMEAPSVDARELKTIDIRAQSDTAQPFSPARGAEIPMRLVVKNSSDFPKKIVHLDISNPTHFRSDFANTREWQRIEITKKRPVSVPITFRQTSGLPGVYHTLIFFDVETNVSGLRQETRIRVPVHVTVGDSQLAAALAPKGEYVKREEAPQLPPNIIAAFPPGRPTKEHIHTPHDTKYTVPLLQYETPEAIQKQINAGGSPPEFPVWNTKDNWRDRMHQLLWWEEAFGRKQVTKYDLWDVQIARVAHGTARTEEPAAEIEVPGLEEKRPSLLKGDRVYVWQLRRGDDAAYEGIVWEVKKSSVIVLFGLSFYKEDPISRWHVRFTYDRLAMRVKHRAVDSVNLEIVYPEAISNERALQTSVKFVDLFIADNAKQSLALRSMLARRNQDQATGRSIPFLLLGPFGTGKTRTLVEYARQVLRDAKARVLFCSFSNSAADRFCEALSSDLSAAEMFRLNAFRRDRGSVLPAVWPYCAYLEDQGVFDLPPMSKLEQFRIIVCTATNAGSLHGLGCKPDHFTHVIVDEAARLEEAECLVPLCLATPATQIVLAGDPKQLGPKVQSKSTRTHGLERSLPERLLQYHLYADGDDRVTVHLLQNYRSHAEIVGLLDSVFYGNIGLHSCAPRAITTSLEQWPKHNTDTSFPFLFISSSGSIAQREADSPSFFNVVEAEICGQVLSELLNSKVGRLVQSDVGVFPATRKQTEKIRKTMRIKGLHGVDVVSVEEAHGKEFKVVVMSCVATARGVRSIEQDRMHDIGYCANAKRLNTAISRAACLVIIIGDPHRLGHDPQWQRIIEACKQRRSYIDAGSSDAFIVGDAADLASKAEEAKQRDEAAREAEAARAQAARKEAAEREAKEAAAAQISRPAVPSGSKATAAAPAVPADAGAEDDEAEAEEVEEAEEEEDEVLPANARRPAFAAVGTPARNQAVAAAAVPATLSPTAAPFRPSNPPGSHPVRSNFAPIPSMGSWLPSPVLPTTSVPAAAIERAAQQAAQGNTAKQQQALPPPGFAPHMVQHPSGYPMILPPFFPILSPQQLHAMYSAPPPLMTGAMAPPGPSDDGFSSAYRPTGARWNNEDLVLTRADSTFAPTFRVLRLTDNEDALEIVFYTAFFVLGDVRSEGRTVTFSMHQPKHGSEVVFTHIPALTNNTKPAVCHVSITVPRGVRVPLDVVDSEDGERRSIKLTFIADATPVSVQVVSGGKRRVMK